MLPIRYSGFWDVPRHILLKYRDTWLFLYSEFNEAVDDYSENYTIYRLPSSIETRLENEPWSFVFDMLVDPLGSIKVQDVEFDESKRKMLDSKCLDGLDFRDN